MSPENTSRIRMHVDPIFHEEIARLPWEVPISEWHQHGVRTLDIKHGISRHVVVFVKTGQFSFAVKEISEEISQKEIRNYEELLLRGIHTLVPAGYVLRMEKPFAAKTPIGIHYEANNISHTITLLVEKVIPDSILYKRAFTFENRKKIWDAIAELFIELHTKGVYWGDASLANTLVKFEKVDIPFVGKRTVLKAYLADAETVEIHPEISPSLREADISFFFESMEWINEDLRASGILRDPLATEDDRAYIRKRYKQLTAVENKKKRFEKKTSLSIDRLLGQLPDPSYIDLLMNHIEEHKWYLNERTSETLSLKHAARDWYENVFVPLCRLFRSEGILEYFPGKTAAELYIEIMTNKYYLSEKTGNDVGMIYATKDYAERFGVEPRLRSLWSALSRKMLSILGLKETIVP